MSKVGCSVRYFCLLSGPYQGKGRVTTSFLNLPNALKVSSLLRKSYDKPRGGDPNLSDEDKAEALRDLGPNRRMLS